ncbi:MAG: LON peptidase substrate-binding domain-containing protein [Candidatus Pseudobacter hemicellulosilyticus]|uniref:LON peptidase substrate-binding domain-containing protein n=1 Tax=Candidatus Pseudobacter hemicellulosilyticus TaxID=3121375 RepID=A0AAJ5WRB3_9BACT|nr:MAG: LON peptidase substrate-binding domain-containing protein [Pseudobacter sp.]
MTNFIPIFPLGVVIYPGEKLHLHVFEPRYKQLITECRESGKPFGILTVVNNRMQDMGTLVELTDIVQTYDNGEMDIKTQGLKVFRVLEVIRSIPEKLYGGAIVNYPGNVEQVSDRELMQKVVAGVKELHRLLNISKDFRKTDEELRAYDVAHHAGLSLEEEYEVLGLLQELQRQEYIRRHLQKVLPMLLEMEQLKEKVKLNGHFRNLSAFDLDMDS